MAAGDITYRITGLYVDYGRNVVTYSITRNIQDSKGNSYSLDSSSQQTGYPNASTIQAMSVASIVNDAPVVASVGLQLGSVSLG